MARSKSIPNDEKEALNYIDDSTDILDEQRLSGLQEEYEMQLIKKEILQMEARRLGVKHGNSHPEKMEAENRLTYNKQMFIALEKEIEKAKIKTDSLSENAWRIHGRVFDQKNKPVRGMTVFLTDQNIRWIEVLGNSCTNELGYYSITINENLFDRNEKEQPIFLTVSDTSKKSIFISKESLLPIKGIVIYRDIFLGQDNCSPPNVENIINKESGKTDKEKK